MHLFLLLISLFFSYERIQNNQITRDQKSSHKLTLGSQHICEYLCTVPLFLYLNLNHFSFYLIRIDHKLLIRQLMLLFF